MNRHQTARSENTIILYHSTLNAEPNFRRSAPSRPSNLTRVISVRLPRNDTHDWGRRRRRTSTGSRLRKHTEAGVDTLPAAGVKVIQLSDADDKPRHHGGQGYVDKCNQEEYWCAECGVYGHKLGDIVEQSPNQG